MTAKFIVEKVRHDGKNSYRFTLVATNGEVIATSESYTTRRAALDGIASVKQNAGAAAVHDQTGE